MALTHEEIRRLIEEAIRAKLGEDVSVWIEAVDDDSFVFDFEGKLSQAKYVIDEEGKITIGEPARVRRSFESFAERSEVMIARVGTYTASSGRLVTFTEKDIADIVHNGNLLAEANYHDSPLVVSHAEGEMGILITTNVFKSPTGGYFHNFQVVGDTALADLREMPKEADEIVGHSGAKISPEFYTGEEANPDFFKKAREVVGDLLSGKVLRRVALVDIPSMKDLNNIPAEAFGEVRDSSRLCLVFSEGPTGNIKTVGGKEDMTTEEIAALKEQIKKEVIEQFSETTGKIKGDLEAVTKERDALKEKDKDNTIKMSEADKATHEADCLAFCEGLKAKAIISPALMELGLVKFMASLPHDSANVVKFGESSESKETTALDFFKGILSMGGKLVSFSETAAPGAPAKGAITAEQKQINDMLGVDAESFEKFSEVGTD